MIARTLTGYSGLVILVGSLLPRSTMAALDLAQAVPTPPAQGTSQSPTVAIPPAATPSSPALPGAGAAAKAPVPPSATFMWTHTFVATQGLALEAGAEVIYAVTSDGGEASRLSAHAMSTGDVLWTHPEQGWQRVVVTEVALVGFVGSRIVALDLKSGRHLWALEAPSGPVSLGATGGWLVAAGSVEVVAINLQAGTVVWRAQAIDVATPPAMAGRTVVFGLKSGHLAAFDIVDGRSMWMVAVGAGVLAVSAGNDAVYAALANGSICAHRVADGGLAWGCQRLKIPALGAPLVDGAVLHVALFDNTLRTFDRRSGVTRRQINLGHRPAGPPALALQSVVVPLVTGAFARVSATRPAPERISAAEAQTFVNLHRAVTADGGRVLLGLSIPPGGQLRLTALRLREDLPPTGLSK